MPRPTDFEPRGLVRFEFDEEKATACAAEFLKRSGGQMKYLRLLKLMYLAERESLKRYGRPIFGDNYFSMQRGPVVGIVYARIKGEELGENDHWHRHIVSEEDFKVRLKKAPERESLSDAEMEILDYVFSEYGRIDRWSLSAWTHTLPEWKDPGESCEKIHPEDILRAVGKSEEEIREIASASEERAHFDRLFTGRK